MEFSELIRQRYSVRAYKPDPVPDDVLQRVLEAARLAPTAANRQPFQFIVIHTEGRKEELRRIYHRHWFVQAPIVICACGVPAQAWIGEKRRSYMDVDVAIAMDHLILAATDAGLGTCWIGAFDPQAAHEILGIPDDVEPIVFTPLGYPADRPEPKERKPLSELVRYEHWLVAGAGERRRGGAGGNRTDGQRLPCSSPPRCVSAIDLLTTIQIVKSQSYLFPSISVY